jgi:very-short-patch-repair endonuclease
MKKLNTKEFIEKGKKIHGNFYNYSLSNYIGSLDKIKIICRIHGEFEIRASSHIRGSGCSLCNIEKRKSNTNEFVEKAKKVHSDKYDYSLVNYETAHIKIQIVCKKHGFFYQTPHNHLHGKGCPNCSKSKKLTQSEFIEKAKKVHGDKYDYSLVNYINNNTKVKIICKKHGIFYQNPNNHISKHNENGCPKCFGTIKSNTKEFIKKSKKIHDDKYDYSLVNYINNNTKVKIICKKHGIFYQKPSKHLIGQGCSKCNFSRGELKIEKYLVENNIIFESQKRFKKCKNKQQLPFDFYLPISKICIEFDGEQHFKPVEYWGGENTYKKRKINDNIKNNYCKENKIELIRIKYNDYNNIERILNTNLRYS